jgi:hypothetical protein
LADANEANFGEAFKDAVAPVKIREGGCKVFVEEMRRGRIAWEKMNAAFLLF